MDLGPQSLPHFITLFLILMAIGVALIVDLLKGNNEQLRELAIELKAKKDAAEKHLQVLEVHTTAMLQQPAAAAAALASAQGGSGQTLLPEADVEEMAAVGNGARVPRPTIVSNNADPNRRPDVKTDVKEAGFHAAARKGRDETKREMSPAVAAVAETVAARMAAGKGVPAAARSGGNPEIPASPAAAASAIPQQAPPPMPTSAAMPEIIVPTPAFAAPATAAGASVGVTPEIIPVDIKTGIFQAPSEIRKDWSRILTSRKHEQNEAQPQHPADSATVAAAAAAAAANAAGSGDKNLLQFVPAVVVDEASVLPAGFHDYSVLRKAAAAGASLQGMVVSIGLNQLESAQMAEVSRFVQSLLEPSDFGCQSGSDEFVVVCLADAMSAQRRLSAIAERLWDFQLRSMGQLNVQFAWGGMEARSVDKLNDVVASAIDQMTETRRARRGSTVQIAKAV
jgi:hypothetical protein